jgi:TRAP-type C4-dicarboxylate transport system permease small subunit
MHDSASPVSPAGQPKETKSRGEFAFEIFCATIFLGMIGLVSYNAFLRYVFRSSFPPSEEWARFLFMYITFFGAIEAFYRGKHIAVDIVVGKTRHTARKALEIIAVLLTLGVLLLLFWGGIILVGQTMDTFSVATGVNMTLVNGILPIMAAAAIVIKVRDLLRLIRKPTNEFFTPDEFVMPEKG